MLIRRSGAAAPLLDAVRNRLKRDQPPTLAGECRAHRRSAPRHRGIRSVTTKIFPKNGRIAGITG